MLYMIVETFRDPIAVYRRFRDRGRLAPNGLNYVNSWVTPDVTRLSYRCPRRADVELYRIEGGGHTWPGSEFSRAIESVVGPTTFSINADDAMWTFFQAHPRRRK